MEVKCVSIELCHSSDDYDNEKPLYCYKFNTTVPLNYHEGLPLINRLEVVGLRLDMYTIGEFYNFYNYGNGPYEGSIYTDPVFREQLNMLDRPVK